MQLTTSLHPVPGHGPVFVLPSVFLTWWLTEHSNNFNFSFIFYISHSFLVRTQNTCKLTFMFHLFCLESGEFKSETVVIITKITVKRDYSGMFRKGPP